MAAGDDQVDRTVHNFEGQLSTALLALAVAGLQRAVQPDTAEEAAEIERPVPDPTFAGDGPEAGNSRRPVIWHRHWIGG